MLLRPGDGLSGAPDPVRRRFEAEKRPRVVTFFRDLYRDAGVKLAGLRAAEHTAQVPALIARSGSRRSATATLPLLFCSPTMELGVDIAILNAVGDAQRAADTGELRPAQRSRRPVGPAGDRRHLLLHRQQPRPLLLRALAT